MRSINTIRRRPWKVIGTAAGCCCAAAQRGEAQVKSGHAPLRSSPLSPIEQRGLDQIIDARRHLHLLTERERAVLDLLATAPSNGAIADRLGITQRTVKAHVSQIVTKLGVMSRCRATVVAFLLRFGCGQHCPHAQTPDGAAPVDAGPTQAGGRHGATTDRAVSRG